MRKLVASVNLTLDGFMAGPDNGLDWHFQCWNDEMAESVTRQLSAMDTILLGGTTYRAMAPYWSCHFIPRNHHPDGSDFAEMMNTYTKIVFSKTISAPLWNNTKLAKGELAEEIASLKRKRGKDIIIFGSGEIISALMPMGLIDEYRLWVHPIAIGSGRPFFRDLHLRLHLELFSSRTFSSGVVLLYYRPRLD